jgi:hypothetical protein
VIAGTENAPATFRLFQFRNDRPAGRMTIDIDDGRSQISGTPQGKLEELFGGYGSRRGDSMKSMVFPSESSALYK